MCPGHLFYAPSIEVFEDLFFLQMVAKVVKTKSILRSGGGHFEKSFVFLAFGIPIEGTIARQEKSIKMQYKSKYRSSCLTYFRWHFLMPPTTDSLFYFRVLGSLT